MRIAEVAPLAESVPPALYGGTERVVSWLTEELVRSGHEVTLFASGDSRTAATLVPVLPRSLRLNRPAPDAAAACARLLETVAEHATDFDIIHSHVDWIHLPLLRRLGTRCVTTLHGRLDLPLLSTLVRPFAADAFVSISDNQRAPLPEVNVAATIHHGLPVDLLRPNLKPEGYLAFLGRIAPEKGPDVAIRIARAAGMKLKIAAKVPRAQSKFFHQRIKPACEGAEVEFVGEVNERQKQAFLGDAAALLFPINWPEPFGLVMIEAMACGTPVLAWRHGAVPEIIRDGVNGFVVASEAEACAALPALLQLDRAKVRAEFERRFTAARMAQDYVDCCSRLLTTSAASPALSNDFPALRRC